MKIPIKILRDEEECLRHFGKQALTPYGESLLVSGDKVDGITKPRVTYSDLPKGEIKDN